MTEGPWHLPYIAVYVRKFADLQASTKEELSIVISYVARNRTRLVCLTSAVKLLGNYCNLATARYVAGNIHAGSTGLYERAEMFDLKAAMDVSL